MDKFSTDEVVLKIIFGSEGELDNKKTNFDVI